VVSLVSTEPVDALSPEQAATARPHAHGVVQYFAAGT
jgi:hypothetical protein